MASLIGLCLQVMPKERRTQLFSATMTSKVAKLQRACLDNPVKVEVDAKYRTVDTLRQQYLFIPAKHKVTLWDEASHRCANLPAPCFTYQAQHLARMTGCASNTSPPLPSTR